MKGKAIMTLGLVALIASTAGAASWNFNSGMDGWTPGNFRNVVPPTWTAWSTAPVEMGSTGSLYLPDGTYAYKDVAATNKFQFTADIGYNYNGSTSRLQKIGLGYAASITSHATGDLVSAWYEGKASNSSEMLFQDTLAVGSAQTGQTGLLKNSAGATPSNMVCRVTIDYNMKEAGKIWLTFKGLNYNVYQANGSPTPDTYTYSYAYTIGINPLTSDYYTVDRIRLGGANTSSWGQVYYDNVSFVPEPATCAMLALGGLTLLRRRRA